MESSVSGTTTTKDTATPSSPIDQLDKLMEELQDFSLDPERDEKKADDKENVGKSASSGGEPEGRRDPQLVNAF
jgi:hypothetical protein